VLSILLVRFSSIGDILLTTPLVRALRRRHPEARLVFVTKRGMAPLVAENPHLSEVVTLAPDEPVRDLARRLRALAPTHGLDLHSSLRTAALRWLVHCRWRGYSKRKIARTMLIATKLDLYGRAVPIAERYFEAARDLDVRPDGLGPEFFLAASARERVAAWLAARGLGDAPLAAERLRGAGLVPVIVGGPDDRGVAQQLAAGGHGVSAAGELSLQETGALIARARCAVSGDTGVMHMATGVHTPVVALFGPTVRQFGFFPYQAKSAVLERPLDCRPCSAMGSRRCPLGHHRCLVDIAPGEVAAAVLGLVA
jgi:heptosyltransferase-2